MGWGLVERVALVVEMKWPEERGTTVGSSRQGRDLLPNRKGRLESLVH